MAVLQSRIPGNVSKQTPKGCLALLAGSAADAYLWISNGSDFHFLEMAKGDVTSPCGLSGPPGGLQHEP